MLKKHHRVTLRISEDLHARLRKAARQAKRRPSDVSQIASKYKDLGLQLADASLLHLANREDIDTVFTLDRRDFSVVRKTGGKKLRVIP